MTKKNLLILFTVLIHFSIKGQVKLGATGSPDNSAMLELQSSNRGFLPPRINLTSVTMMLNGVVPADGMMIYSTNPTIGTGLYVWYSSKWNRLIEKLDPATYALFKGLTTTSSEGIQWSPVAINQPNGRLPMFSSSQPSRVYIRTTGLYIISASFAVDNFIGQGRITMTLNGGDKANVFYFNRASNVQTPSFTSIHFLMAGDYITIVGPDTDLNLSEGTTQLAITEIPSVSY